jgi:branched-chain amino acid transport system permease protein
MLQYVIAGLVLGGIYAISAASLIATYRSAGILNFSFGAMAYFVARFYYFVHVEQEWSIALSAVVSLLVVAPAMGVLLYVVLFRFLRMATTLVKVVAMLGLSVCIPPIATLVFGDLSILQAPGLAPQPVTVFHPFGVPLTMDQLIVYISVVAIGLVGVLVLKYSQTGLRVRAMVDSPAMTSLTGTSPTAVSLGVWAFSTFLAGLAGVLSAPIIGLDSTVFTYLMAAAFAAVIAAKLWSLPIAVLVGLGIGIAGSMVQSYLPPNSSLTAAALPSIPFIVTALFLTYNTIRRSRLNEDQGVGGALDRAIVPQGSGATKQRYPSVVPRADGGMPWLRTRAWEPSTLVIVAVGVILTFTMAPFWTSYLPQGAAIAVIFLSYTLVTGEGGMIWLCQITFAGIGALTAAQLATERGWPVEIAVLVGGLLAGVVGLIVSLITVRLGALYTALVTLTFGLLVERLVFTRDTFAQRGIGVPIDPPSYADTDGKLTILCLAVFLLVAYFIINLRRSTTGLALNAVRWSEAGARTIGVSPRQSKIMVGSIAAVVAGIGGGLLAIANGTALPANFSTLEGIIFLATLVAMGVRSNAGALIAGLTYTLSPALLQVYVDPVWAPVPIILFGVGAVYVTRNADGWIPELGGQLYWLAERAGRVVKRSDEPPHGSGSALAGAHDDDRPLTPFVAETRNA